MSAPTDTAEPALVVEDTGDVLKVRFPVLVVEGMDAGDGRLITPGGFGCRPLPLSIAAQPYDPHGGQPAPAAEVFGHITTAERHPGPEVISPSTGEPFPEGVFVWSAEGEIDANHRWANLVRKGYLRGVSVVMGDMDAELIGEEEAALSDNPRRWAVVNSANIACVTLVPVPAFADTHLELVNDDTAMVAAADLPSELHTEPVPPWLSADLGDELLADELAAFAPTAESRRDAKKQGDTLPGTDKYPIRNREELRKAIKLAGSSTEDNTKVRRYIRRKARELKAEDEIPDSWAAFGEPSAALAAQPGDVATLEPEAPGGPSVAGVALMAADTGRALMLQRGLDDDDDPAAGTWEFPGGHTEPGDGTLLAGGMREWAEEIGQPFPAGGILVHTWTTGEVYQGHVVVIGAEKAVDLTAERTVANTDDDYSNQAAWWDVDDARRNPALRPECKATPWNALKKAVAAVGDLAVPMPEPEPAMVAAGSPVRPSAWFTDPRLDGPTAVTVTDDGRVYGHLAAWDVPHIGMPGQYRTAPRSASDYAYFATGAVRCEDGAEVAVGHITMDTGHAGMSLGHPDVTAHYDNTGSVVADVAAGEDTHGIWVAGAVRTDVTDGQVATLRASALSGDWRRIGAGLELVAALAVNTPGFPVPRARIKVGQPVALVAAGVLHPEPSAAMVLDYDTLAAAIASRLRASDADERERAALAAELADDDSDEERLAALAGLDEGEEFAALAAFVSEHADDASFASLMPAQLQRSYLAGKVAARIAWGTPGDFRRCVVQAKGHGMGRKAEGACNYLHNKAVGFYPGDKRNR
jgi:8-oxo-dGTP pyrophosphatase MutT (NUDIX family)